MMRSVRRSLVLPLATAAVLLVVGCSKGTAGTGQAPAPQPGAPAAEPAPAPSAP
ncbi:MAG: invasion associated locus B family protein, partial [Thermoanaerobaculia bacterium]